MCRLSDSRRGPHAAILTQLGLCQLGLTETLPGLRLSMLSPRVGASIACGKQLRITVTRSDWRAKPLASSRLSDLRRTDGPTSCSTPACKAQRKGTAMHCSTDSVMAVSSASGTLGCLQYE